MKKIILFFIVLFAHATIHTMFITHLVRAPRTKSLSRPISTATTRKHPYIEDVYLYVENKKIPCEKKQEFICERLDHDPDLSFEERQCLYLLKNIISPGQPPALLHKVVTYQDNELLKIAFSFGLKKHINAKDVQQNTPLYIATIRGYSLLIPTFIANKVDVNAKNQKGETSLMGAIKSLENPQAPISYDSFFNIISDLRKAGADPRIADDSQKTVFDYITAIIEAHEAHRARTMYSEDGEWIAMYRALYNDLLKEWAKNP